LWREEGLLPLLQELVEARLRHDIAEDLQAPADELSALLDIRIQHVEVADIVVVDVAGPRSHVSATKEFLDEAVDVALDPVTESLLLILRKRDVCRGLQAIKVALVIIRPITGKDSTLEVAAFCQCFIGLPLLLSFGLIGDLEVLGRQQLVRMLRVRVWIVFLILGDVESLQSHVLLRA